MDGSIAYSSSVIGDLEERRYGNSKDLIMGNVAYDSISVPVLVPEKVSNTYYINLKQAKKCNGLFINSHRSLFHIK